jgi:hypothetical protein
MCDDAKALLEHAETIVLSSTSEEAAQVLHGMAASQAVVDLTRGALPRPSVRKGVVSSIRKNAAPGARRTAVKSIKTVAKVGT